MYIVKTQKYFILILCLIRNGKYGRQERCIQNFDGEIREKKTTGEISVYGRIILKWTCKKWDGCIDWFDLAYDGGKVAGCCE